VPNLSLLIVGRRDEDLHTPVHSNHAVLSTPTDKQTFNVQRILTGKED